MSPYHAYNSQGVDYMKVRFFNWMVILALFISGAAFAIRPDGKNEAVSAKTVAGIEIQLTPNGFFFRGDNRPPSTPGTGIFTTGFRPQGTNTDLAAHLSFRGDSAYVSTSRSDLSAEQYVYGRSAAHNSDGYLYVISQDTLPDGYWIPGLYPNDPAVRNNQEFAVYGTIQPADIAGAFHYFEGQDVPVEWIPNPNYGHASTSPYNPSRDGQYQDICTVITAIAAYLCGHDSKPR